METLFDALSRLDVLEPMVDERNVIIASDAKVNQLVESIEAECDTHLINNQGQLHLPNVERLIQRGYPHKVFEQDGFGPLVCGIKTRKGWITYG